MTQPADSPGDGRGPGVGRDDGPGPGAGQGDGRGPGAGRGDGALDLVAHLSLDRSSPVPLYYQVARHLEEGIESGRLPPGTRLDNEVQLAASLGLSRPTMRQAMLYLVDKGLIVRRRGVGTRVVQPKVRRALELTSLFDDLRRADQDPVTRVISLEVAPAAPDVARALGLADGEDAVTVVRLRSSGQVPIARLTNSLRVGVVDLTADELERTGLYSLVRGAGITLHSAGQVIGARTATREEAELLDETTGAALLTMERTAYDDHGTPVEYGRHVYVASRYSFEMSLLAP